MGGYHIYKQEKGIVCCIKCFQAEVAMPALHMKEDEKKDRIKVSPKPGKTKRHR